MYPKAIAGGALPVTGLIFGWRVVAAAALAEVLRPRLPDSERREIENLIATLRLNFVEQKSKAR